jgi:hypothetical protein
MRALLIGSDFMYDKNGTLKPIEINTNTGWDYISKVEDNNDSLDLTNLYEFIETNGFTSIHYIGEIIYLHQTLETHYTGSSVVYQFHQVGIHSITVPFIEDNDETLIIRSAYDTTALVDDTYCRDKVEFMKLIQSQSFGSQFAYLDESNQLVSNITTINDNGVHPNFVLKSRYPAYNKEVYPKFYKVSTQEELNVILENVTSDYFLMENYCNTTNDYEGHTKVIRSLNILYLPTLESIQIGQYTKFNQNICFTDVEYNSETYELSTEYRDSYTTNPFNKGLPKLLDTDLVEMSDGTFKTPLELVIGDIIKTIDIPNPNGVDNTSYRTNFGITYETLISGTTYSTNRITNLKRINLLSHVNQLTFDDDSNWEDTAMSSYLIERDNIIQFKQIAGIITGDVVLLLDTTEGLVDFIRKTVVENVTIKKIFSGWTITVENTHLFLTKTASTNNETFVSIEHNAPGSGYCLYEDCGTTPFTCGKDAPYCGAYGECFPYPDTFFCP